MKIVKNFRHIGIVTDNLNKSIKFYQNILGLKPKVIMNEKGKITEKIINLKKANLKTVKLINKKNQPLIELLYFRNKNVKKDNYRIDRVGCSHFAITISNMKKFFNNLKKNKINYLSEPTLSNDKKVILLFCRAPEGTLIEVVQVL
ncbi:VOC family protein [Candidatus Pelagibacter sp.]|nr:VOC family protein [Candidatus Pelagibacter sp.]